MIVFPILDQVILKRSQEKYTEPATVWIGAIKGFM